MFNCSIIKHIKTPLEKTISVLKLEIHNNIYRKQKDNCPLVGLVPISYGRGNCPLVGLVPISYGRGNFVCLFYIFVITYIEGTSSIER
jgi:hypothetical protein